MGKLFEREYYKIGVAAEELGCTVDDMIHWAATGRITLGVLFAVDSFAREQYSYYGENPWESMVEEFTGFAYLDGGYFKALELSGNDLQFNSVRLIDGRTILKHPFDDNLGVETRSNEQIYIHSNDLRTLLLAGAPSAAEKAVTTKERTTLLTIVALLAKEAKIDLTRPSKAAATIVEIAQIEGYQIGQRTIEEHLKKIPDALQRRGKDDS